MSFLVVYFLILQYIGFPELDHAVAKLQLPLEPKTVMIMPPRHTVHETRKAIVLIWIWESSGIFWEKSAVMHSSISISYSFFLSL